MIKILNFIKSNFIFKIFRNIPIPFIIIFCFLNGQNELNGKWYKDRTNWKIYLNINTSNEGQTLDQYIKVGDKQNLIYSKNNTQNLQELYQLDISGNASGIYMIRLKVNNQIVNHKIILQ